MLSDEGYNSSAFLLQLLAYFASGKVGLRLRRKSLIEQFFSNTNQLKELVGFI
jgi:hypothetical protein